MKIKFSFLIILFQVFFSGTLLAQRKTNFGLEFQANFNDWFIQRGINTFFIYEKAEVYLGYSQNGLGSGWLTIYSFEAGSKYHFTRPKRKSHFFVEFNYQKRQFWENMCVPHMNIKHEISIPECVVRKASRNIVMASGGYECFFINRLSFVSSIGGGLIKKDGTVTPNGIAFGYPNESKWDAGLFVKLGVRAYVFRNEKHLEK